MDTLWSDFWATAVLLPLTFLLSMLFNVRRTEDSSYGLWSALLLQLCGNRLDIFVLCPQYRLYVPRHPNNQPADADTSMITTSDGQARGVIVDHSLILPEIQPVHWGNLFKYLTHLFQSPQPSFSEFDVRTINATVPVIVEQKRPPSRHPKDILSYYEQLGKLLRAAADQATDQAVCLFSMLNYGHQQEVILIAATGAWWQFRLSRRGDTGDPFIYEDYALKCMLTEMEEEKEDVEDAHDANDLMHPAVAMLLARWPLPSEEINIQDKHQIEAGRLYRLREKARQVDKDDSAARADRYARRNSAKEKETATKFGMKIGDRWKKFVKDVGQGPYSPEDIDMCVKLQREMDAGSDLPFCHKFEGWLDPHGNGLTQWTGPMRLGSPISNKYMVFIKAYLDRLAEEEESRRRRV
ncbi:hypothetical protein CCMSSC00406_0009626 [Pleurotus cornucopiae]|uniref:Uncharacterized protein n=1 Tax=Pleurotus cornucopiae TaxID=5321 RepID=A0ACB7IQT8_PLECO|nr:hypothetical protein CCMSSC00406_0009626 [Pleurotus cornucopiae]